MKHLVIALLLACHGRAGEAAACPADGKAPQFEEKLAIEKCTGNGSWVVAAGSSPYVVTVAPANVSYRTEVSLLAEEDVSANAAGKSGKCVDIGHDITRATAAASDFMLLPAAQHSSKMLPFKAIRYYLQVTCHSLVQKRAQKDCSFSITFVKGTEAEASQIQHPTPVGSAVATVATNQLHLHMPVLASASEPLYFVYESFKGTNDRSHLLLRVRPLAGMLKVKVAFVMADCKDCAEAANLRLTYATALGTAREVQQHYSFEYSAFLFEVTGEELQLGCQNRYNCHVLLSVQCAQQHRWADFQVRAIDELDKESQLTTLFEGISSNSWLAKERELQRFQIFISNPTAEVRITLTCTEISDPTLCDKIEFSADARSGPTYPEKPSYMSSKSGSTHLIEVMPRASSSLEDEMREPGLCWVPCALMVHARLKNPGGRIGFTVVASRKMAYKWLPEGTTLEGTAEPAFAEYFLFDSRRATVMTSIVLTIPFDSSDSDAQRVSLYVVDCTRGSQDVAELMSAQEHPSREYTTQKGVPNGRMQLVAFIAKPGLPVAKSFHCYNRIAVVNNRFDPMPFRITAIDWRLDSQPLRYSVPLEAALTSGQSCEFYFATHSRTAPRLSLEVCSGEVEVSFHPPPAASGGGSSAPATQSRPFTALQVPGQDWTVTVKSHSPRGNPSVFILTADEGPTAGSTSLRLPADPELRVTQLDETSLKLDWDITQQCVSSGGANSDGCIGTDRDYVAEYEVFRLISGKIDANLSSVCSLYRHLSTAGMKTSLTGGKRTLYVNDLQPGTTYEFVVVAKSIKGALSVAYPPRVHRMWRKELKDPSSSFLDWLLLLGGIAAAGAVIYKCWKPLRVLAFSEPIWHRYTLHEHRRMMAERRAGPRHGIDETERPLLLRVFRRW